MEREEKDQHLWDRFFRIGERIGKLMSRFNNNDITKLVDNKCKSKRNKKSCVENGVIIKSGTPIDRSLSVKGNCLVCKKPFITSKYDAEIINAKFCSTKCSKLFKFQKTIFKIPKKELYKLYVSERKSARAISKIYNVSDTTIGKLLMFYEIIKFPTKEIQSISQTGIIKGKYNLTEETRKKYSDRQIEGLKNGTLKLPTKSRGKGGIREDLGLYLRSTWEGNYARYLNILVNNNSILKWEYEVDQFIFHNIKIGTRGYLPDFKIFNNNGTIEYHEVKGWMDAKSKTKINRMAKYYPNVKLIIIDNDWFKANTGRLKGFIPNWE